MAANESYSGIVRLVLDDHWALHDELSGAVGGPGDERGSRLIHSLLAQTEARIASSYDAAIRRVLLRLDSLHSQTDLIATMIARAYFGYLTYTPETPDELREAAVASAKKRYARWERSIARIEEGETAQNRSVRPGRA